MRTTATTMLLADDHEAARWAIAQRLDLEPDLSVVAQAADSSGALTEALRVKPAVVVMDVEMPGVSAFEAMRQILALAPGTAGVFFSPVESDHYFRQAMRVGARGYVLKTCSFEALLAAIRSVAVGERYIASTARGRRAVESHASKKSHLVASSSDGLTPREIEVLQYLARGASKKDMAALMTLSLHTIERHVENIMSKLDIHDRVHLALYAVREKYIGLNMPPVGAKPTQGGSEEKARSASRGRRFVPGG
ncbi:MAG: response regulator [Phycisphaerae bacterium]